MPEQHFSTFSEGLTAHRPKDMKELMACISLMQPMLDAIPNAVIFVKDAQARYLMANRTLVERCGLKSLAPLLGRTSAQVFPAQLGPGFALLLRGHRFMDPPRVGGAGARIVDVTGYPEVNDLILAADAAVLDYSSMRFDVALTGIPMVFLVPDLATYATVKRGFLYPFEPTAPGPLLATRDEVVAALRDLDGVRRAHATAYAAFNREYNAFQDGRAARRAVERFFVG